MRNPQVIPRTAIICALTVMLTEGATAQAEPPKETMVGTWKLLSWVTHSGGAQKPGVLGSGTLGQFMLNPDGHFCIGFVQPDRAKFASPDYRGGTVEERTQAWDTYAGYCGTFELSSDGSFVLFKIEISSYPNWTGTAQKRFVTISGDRMTLRTPPMMIRGQEAVGELIWERVR